MGDIRQATSIARKMVCAWGMSERMGMVEYGDEESAVFLARDMSRSRNYSEHTAQMIDEEVKRLIDEAYAKATQVLTQYRDKLDLIATALLEFETLDGSHIKEIMATGSMQNPPPTISKSQPPPPLPKTPDSRPVKQEDEDEGGLAPAGLAAPA
jgi:cell division protease FtsH